MNSKQYPNPQLRDAFAVFVAIAGLIGVAVTLLLAKGIIQIAGLVLLIGVALVLAFGVGIPELKGMRKRWRRPQLPKDLKIVDQIGASYRVEQATWDEVAWIAELEAAAYSREDAIPEHLLREWYSINPTGFSIIKAADGRPVGHLDILPLQPRTLEAFLKGEIVEREIRGDSLYAVGNRSLIRHLYVESIILW